MDDLEVVSDGVAKLINADSSRFHVDRVDRSVCARSLSKSKVSMSSNKMEILLGFEEIVGSIYFFVEMASVYKRYMPPSKDALFTEKAIGSAGYSDPDFFKKILEFVDSL